VETIIEEVRRHAATEAPAECCGLVLRLGGELVYAPCRNTAADPTQRFVIAPEEYAQHEDRGEILLICHSHTEHSAEASEADIDGVNAFGIPWLIVSHPSGAFRILRPNSELRITNSALPLIGRPFCYGTLDCCTLVCDYYAQKLSIPLADFPHPSDWPRSGPPEYLTACLRANGFVEAPLSEVAVHDVLAMRVGAGIVNHLAIYIGDGMILQHLEGRLSARDVYGDYWRRATISCFRKQFGIRNA
jgi:proteasome lid subunit RPN8/RPN11